jgi:hypothetical protein
MRTWRPWVLSLVIVAVVACGKTNGLLPPPDDGGGGAGGATLPAAATCTGPPVADTEAKAVDSISEDVDGTCASVAGFLPWKAGLPGSACSTPTDCAPVCVPCPNGTHHSLASWCSHGQCAGPDAVACVILGTPGLQGCSTTP